MCRTRIGRHGLICGACFAKIDFIAPPLCDRLGVPPPYRRAAALCRRDRQAASLRPGAGRGALFLDHARACPELQISRPARGAAAVRPLAEQGRR
ncbi:MAG TPA: double zinc ribbon domain-containing protein [Methyloceanibacter sp.]